MLAVAATTVRTSLNGAVTDSNICQISGATPATVDLPSSQFSSHSRSYKDSCRRRKVEDAQLVNGSTRPRTHCLRPRKRASNRHDARVDVRNGSKELQPVVAECNGGSGGVR